jgi:CRP-like cAMP-binding protein
MQTQTLVQSAPRRPGLGPVSNGLSAARQSEAEEACQVYFARTAPVGPASDDDRRAIRGSVVDTVSLGSGGNLYASSGSSTNLRLILGGWIYRAQVLPNGSRQITDLLLPGEFVEPPSSAASICHEFRACGRVEMAVMCREIVTGRNSFSLWRRWEWTREEQARILRSRLVSLGRRDAFGRLAHLMTEFYARLGQVGMAANGTFACPLTQEQLADVLGLTSVHVNRVLQRLRREGLVVFSRGQVVLPSLARLHAAGLYEGA